MEKGRHRVFNFAMSSFDVSLLNDKLDYVFKELKCAAKVNLAFGFVLKKIEEGMCRYFYAHENNTIMERAKLLCTQADMTGLKTRMQKMDVVDICTRETANTKWKYYNFTNLTIFDSLLNDVPMGCKDTVLPEPLLKNHNVNCLTFERNTRQPYNDNLCLFRALALHLHGYEKREEETSKNFNLFLNNREEGDVSKFQGVHLNDIPKIENLLQLNIFLYDIDFVDGDLIGKLARRSFQKYEKNSNFYTTTITFATSTTSTQCLKPSGVQRKTHFSQRRGIWNDIWLLVVIVLNIFIQRMFTNWEKPFLKSWMQSTFHMEVSKNCSRTWQHLTLSPFVSRKNHTSKLRLQRGLGSMSPYQFPYRQTWSRNPFFSATPILIISYRLLLLLLKDEQPEAKLKPNWILFK